MVDFGRSLSELVKHDGSIQTTSDTVFEGRIGAKEGDLVNLAVGALSLGAIDVEAYLGVNVGFGNRNMETMTVDFQKRYDLVLQKTAFNYASEQARNSDGSIDPVKFEKVFGDTLNGLRKGAIDTVQSYLEGEDPSKYGASAPFAIFKTALEKLNIKDTEAERILNMYKEQMVKEFTPNKQSMVKEFTPKNNSKNDYINVMGP